MQSPELFACLSKERKENLLGTLLFRPSIYERLYYEEEMVRKQIVRNPQIRAAAPEIDFEFEEFSANSYLSLVDEYLYWNKVPGDILLRLKKAAEDALAYARENKNFRQNEETLLRTPHTIQGYLGEISISEMLDTYVNGCETMEGVHASIDKTREFLFYCGMFHDAGKLYFLDTINLFARSLFNEEFDLIRLPRCGNRFRRTRLQLQQKFCRYARRSPLQRRPYVQPGSRTALCFQDFLPSSHQQNNTLIRITWLLYLSAWPNQKHSAWCKHILMLVFTLLIFM